MFKKIFLFVLVVCVGATGVVYYLYNKPVKDDKVDSSIQGIQVSALNLSKEFANNEQNANTKYLDKVIDVTGLVTELEHNQDGGYMVVLQTDDPMMGIQCAMRDTKATATKGATLSIKGKCSGYGITGVTLTGCVITN